MFCPKCGNKMNKDAKYCNVCGAPVQSSEIVPVSPQAIVPKSGGSKSVLVCIIVVLLGIIAVAGFYIATSLNKEQNEPLYSPPYIEGDAEEEYSEPEIIEENGDFESSETEVSESSVEERKPTYTSLFDLSPYVGELPSKSRVQDNLGNIYSRCYVAFDDFKSATFYLGDKYTELTATIAVTKADVNTALFTDNYASITIKGDGKVLYENMMLAPDTKPIEISCDVSGVEDLVIEMQGKNTNLNYYDGLYIIMANAELKGE